MYENLFNHFFQVEKDKENKEDYHKILGINDDSVDMKTIKNYSIAGAQDKEQIDLLPEKKEKLNMSCFSKWLMLNCCPCYLKTKNNNKHYLLYYNGKAKICSYLEASNYLLKIHQVDMLRQIIETNDDKIKNAEYMYTQVLSFNEDKGRFTYLVPE